MQPGHRPFPQQVAPMPLGSTPTRRPAPMAGAAQQLAPLPGAHHHHLQPQLQPHQQPQRYSEQATRHPGRTPYFQQPQQIYQHTQGHPHSQQYPQHQQHPRHTPAPMPMAPGPHHHHQAPLPMAHPGHPGHHMQQHMHSQQQAAAAAAAAVQQQAAQQQNMAIEAAKRRSRKPTDKTMADGVDNVIIGDGVQRYRELRDFERRLDATMTRKRLDVVDSIQRPGAKRYKTLRIWISNTVENQQWQASSGVNVDSFDFSTNSEASYRVKIEGRLLDDGDDEDEESNAAKGADGKANKEGDKAEGADGDAMETDGAADSKPGKQARHHLTQFFRAIVIEYNAKKSVLPENAPKPIEWKRPETRPPPPVPGQPVPAAPQVPEYDELTFKRPGDENVNVTIKMFRYDEPERFELDEILADIVDMKEATRAEAVMGLFEYIRLQGLQEDEEKRNFRCDDLLKKLVASDIGYIPMLYEYVNKHIRQLPPVQLVYTIRVDEAFHKQAAPPATIYDIRVAVDDPLRAQLRPFVQSPQYMGLLRDVGALDEQLALLVQAISISKSKHEFLSALAKDPALFVRQWLSSQKRDLEVIMGESVRGVSGGAGGAGVSGGDQSGESWWRRGGQSSVWASQNARESVNLLLAKQPLIPRPV